MAPDQAIDRQLEAGQFVRWTGKDDGALSASNVMGGPVTVGQRLTGVHRAKSLSSRPPESN